MNRFIEPQIKDLVGLALANGGEIRYIEPFKQDKFFPSTCNPSIVYDEQEDKFYMTARKVSYVLHASTTDNNWGGSWGRLIYSIPQGRTGKLETRNVLCEMTDPMKDNFQWQTLDNLPHRPQWTFTGLEDMRLSIWNDKLYATPVVRDDNNTGIGRCHALEYKSGHICNDVKLAAINNEYCVKNIMPVEDKPFTYVYSINPVTVVNYNCNGDITFVNTQEGTDVKQWRDFKSMIRGSSQLIKNLEGNYWCIVHSCEMYYTPNGRKDARYLHCFVELSPDFKIKRVSPMFSFANFPVEFTCGMARKGNDIYITFALQDNVSYVLKTSGSFIDDLLCNYQSKIEQSDRGVFWMSTEDAKKHMYNLFDKHDFSGAYTWACYLTDHCKDSYESRFMMARCIADIGDRDLMERSLWSRVIENYPDMPEGLMGMAMYFYCRNDYALAYLFGQRCMMNMRNYSGTYYNRDMIERCWNKIRQNNGDGQGIWKKAL